VSSDQDPDDEWEEAIRALEDGGLCADCGVAITQEAFEQGDRFCPDCSKNLFGEISESDDSDDGWCPYCIDKTVDFRVEVNHAGQTGLESDVFCSRCSRWLQRHQVLDGELSPSDYVPVSIGRDKLGWVSVYELQDDVLQDDVLQDGTPESSDPKQPAKKKTAPRSSRRCPRPTCNKKVKATASYCKSCGIRLDNYCPNPKCNKRVQKTANYCDGCGHQLKS
jgi:hypothetical protein